MKNKQTPLPLKGLAIKVMMHHRLRLIVGLNLAIIVLFAALFTPFPSLATNIGGPNIPDVIPEGETHLTTKLGVVSPLPKLNKTQGFWLLHPGVDLATETGTLVKPIMGGVITKTESNWFGYGNMIIVSHNADFESLYAHLSKINVKVGDEVTTDTIIGLSGSTGRSTGPHLHLEVHQDGKAIDPGPILGLK